MKLGQTRKSKECICEKPNGKCFDKVEMIISENKKCLAWVIHCKTLDRIAKQAVGLTNKVIK